MVKNFGFSLGITNLKAKWIFLSFLGFEKAATGCNLVSSHEYIVG